MKPVRCVVLLLLLSLVAGTGWCWSETPTETVLGFYQTVARLKVFGLPGPYDLMYLSSYLSLELVQLIEQNQLYREDFVRAFPGDVPPLADGDLFSSLFEGFSAYEVTRSLILTNEARVYVGFTYYEPSSGRPFYWEDIVKLTKTPYGWVISDIVYMGKWDFSYGAGNTLTNVLKTVLRH